MDLSISNQDERGGGLLPNPPDHDARDIGHNTNRARWGLQQGQNAPSSSQQVEDDERRMLYLTPSMTPTPTTLRGDVAVAQEPLRVSDPGVSGVAAPGGLNGRSRVLTPPQSPDALSLVPESSSQARNAVVPEQISVPPPQTPPHNPWYTSRAERQRGPQQRHDVLPDALPLAGLPSSRTRRTSRGESSAYAEHQGLRPIAPRSLITDLIHNAIEGSHPSPRRRVNRRPRVRTLTDQSRDTLVDPAVVQADRRAFSSIEYWGLSAGERARARDTELSSRGRRDLANADSISAMSRFADQNRILVNPDDLRRQYWDTDHGIPVPSANPPPDDIPPIINGPWLVNPRNRDRAEQATQQYEQWQPGPLYGSGALNQSPIMTPSQFSARQTARAAAAVASSRLPRLSTSSDSESLPTFEHIEDSHASLDFATSPPSSSRPRSSDGSVPSPLPSLISFDGQPAVQHAEYRDRGLELDTDSDTSTIVSPISIAILQQKKERYFQLCEEYGHCLDRHCTTVYSQARRALTFDTERFSTLPDRSCFRDIGKDWLSKEVSGIREAVAITRDFLVKFSNLPILSRPVTDQGSVPKLGELCQLLHTRQFWGERLLWSECIKLHTRKSTREILYARGITPELEDPRPSRMVSPDVPESSIQRNPVPSPGSSVSSRRINDRRLLESSFERRRSFSPFLDAPIPSLGSPVTITRSPGPTPGMETPPRAPEDFFNISVRHLHPTRRESPWTIDDLDLLDELPEDNS